MKTWQYDDVIALSRRHTGMCWTAWCWSASRLPSSND